MTLDEFRQSLTATEPPAGLTHALAGLWWDAKGDWARVQESALDAVRIDVPVVLRPDSSFNQFLDSGYANSRVFPQPTFPNANYFPFSLP
ncbi:MAG TPA: hypothetical protein VNZ03_04075 [Terriglobales bacterium]|jgi:hypothetical protein|nr:hypothetical protein [Terriglobales bacterium]